MCRTDYRLVMEIAALGLALGVGGAALAAPESGVEIRLAARAIALVEPRGGARAVPETEPISATAPEVAAVTFSRASDVVGRPVYFSRARNPGVSGQVNFSARTLPADAVFSIALAPPRIALSPSGPLRFSGKMPSLLPVSARALTSGFGLRQHPLLGTVRTHSGVDLAASYGSPIVATSDGVVGAAAWSGGYGLLVALDHGNGLQTRYAHMSRFNVVPGQQVGRGDVIGFVGSTGMSTGPHLHYEIRVNGRPVDPVAYLHGR